ncbi:hypothetical protein [Tropicimonas sp. S265A]|uniref:hypothetical protein n=1 Tax=Tropicimonas sp. S265A TaxID=3415134 RepID=UPI003C7ABF67
MSGGAVLFFWVLAICYCVQLALVVAKANEVSTGSDTSLAARMFADGTARRKTTVTVLFVFVIPVMISWCASIANLFNVIEVPGAVYFGCLSMLFVLITLEFGLLNSLTGGPRKTWTELVSFALILDLLSVILLLAVINPIAFAPVGGVPVKVGNWTGLNIYLYVIAAAAFFSSFTVVLFSMAAEREDSTNPLRSGTAGSGGHDGG